MNRSHRLRIGRASDERGVAVVEFAIVLPLLILLVFGIVEFSIAYNRQQGLHAAAREGARVAALPQTTSDEITDRVRTALNGVLSPSEVSAATITVTPNSSQPCNAVPAGTHVVVTVAAPDQLQIPLFKKQSLTLTGTGEFLCE